MSTQHCPECDSARVSKERVVHQPLRLLDPTLGMTVEIPCYVPVFSCVVCGAEWTGIEGELNRTSVQCDYFMRRAKELHEQVKALRAQQDA